MVFKKYFSWISVVGLIVLLIGHFFNFVEPFYWGLYFIFIGIMSLISFISNGLPLWAGVTGLNYFIERYFTLFYNKWSNFFFGAVALVLGVIIIFVK